MSKSGMRHTNTASITTLSVRRMTRRTPGEIARRCGVAES
jgi:hypothetical protein